MQSVHTPPVARHLPSPALAAFTVWKALFLREASYRLMGRRGAWAWVMVEPLCHIFYLSYVYVFIRMRKVGGINVAVWVMVGTLAFFMFRRTAIQCMNAVNSNRALFVYRQVKPVDTVLVRAWLEGFLAIVITISVFIASGLFGLPVFPDDPLTVLQAMFGLWLLGLSYGLVSSVALELSPEMSSILNILMIPLYLLSGVMLPLYKVPTVYREWLMMNPVAHGLEAARHGYSSYYESIPEVSLAYLYGWAVVMLLFGLALHRRYAYRMIAK